MHSIRLGKGKFHEDDVREIDVIREHCPKPECEFHESKNFMYPLKWDRIASCTKCNSSLMGERLLQRPQFRINYHLRYTAY